MFVFDEVLIRCRVERPDLKFWIERDWVRPTQENEEWHFGDEDVARVELICDLVRDLDIDPEALDIILPLLDQVYSLRRSIRAMTLAVGELPADSRQKVMDRLADRSKP
jgi:chaperone modulatory protein CbpM